MADKDIFDRKSCSVKQCFNPRAKNSEKCPKHKKKPADDRLPSEMPVLSEYRVEFTYTYRASVTVVADDVEQAKVLADARIDDEDMELVDQEVNNLDEIEVKKTNVDEVREERREMWNGFQEGDEE